MTWTVVEGTYRNGQIYLKEKFDNREPLDVLVLIPEKSESVDQEDSWHRLRQAIAAEMSDLLTRDKNRMRLEFERLSAQVAQNMPYGTVEEFEQAMRGGHYGLILS